MKHLFAILRSKNNGYSSEIQKVQNMNIGEIYRITNIEMGQSSTTLKLGDLGYFNSINFSIVDANHVEYDIWSDPEFNPYLTPLHKRV